MGRKQVHRLSDLSVLSMGEREACAAPLSDSEMLHLSTLGKGGVITSMETKHERILFVLKMFTLWSPQAASHFSDIEGRVLIFPFSSFPSPFPSLVLLYAKRCSCTCCGTVFPA